MNQTFINLSIYQHLSTLNHQLPLKRFKPRSAATPPHLWLQPVPGTQRDAAIVEPEEGTDGGRDGENMACFDVF